MVGILIHGNNHFILGGPEPAKSTALALARHWSIIQIEVLGGKEKPLRYEEWEIRTKEFRENLEWAVLVSGDGEICSGVTQLLAEVSARGISIKDYRG
jgi:hypothetical protein